MVYRTEDAAIRRIGALIAHGIWPGYYRARGGWVLTYDPPDVEFRIGQAADWHHW